MPRPAPWVLAAATTAVMATAFAAVLLHCGRAPAPPPPEPVVLPPPSANETRDDILERKRLFIALLLPLVQAENARLLADRARIDRIERELVGEDDISRADFEWLKATASAYALNPRARRNAEFFASLRQRVDIVPAALVLAQAALESGWGRSAVAREANNFFGHYCFGRDCGLPAPGAGDLRVFDSPADSLQAYLHNLNSHDAYGAFRQARAALRARGEPPTGRALAPALTAYSERGEAYVADLLALIRANDLDALPSLPAGR